MIAAGQLMTCMKSLQAIWNEAKKNTLVKIYLGAKLQTSRKKKKKKARQLQLSRVIEIYYFHPWVGLLLHHHSTSPVCCCQWQNVVWALVMSNWKHLTERTTQSLPHPPLCCSDWTIRTLLLLILLLDLRGNYIKCWSFPFDVRS